METPNCDKQRGDYTLLYERTSEQQHGSRNGLSASSLATEKIASRRDG